MKALFINGGPRKNWTTVQVMGQTMKGAADAWGGRPVDSSSLPVNLLSYILPSIN